MSFQFRRGLKDNFLDNESEFIRTIPSAAIGNQKMGLESFANDMIFQAGIQKSKPANASGFICKWEWFHLQMRMDYFVIHYRPNSNDIVLLDYDNASFVLYCLVKTICL